MDLFDQETIVTREATYNTIVGKIYRIVSQNTLDFTTIELLKLVV